MIKGWKWFNLKGIIRRVDVLGRIVLPKAFREACGINSGDEVEIVMKGNGIYLQKHNRYARCAMTGEVTEDIKVYGNGIFLSRKGREQLLEDLKREGDS
ncbi:AbrB/MazE/SpoVT family DNA-binding domain-containing protein [Bacillus paralicheniformis]|uniref:AbrB/MazE/SpoVT family DNA-binding domain-containing protein n=1 Tax=Bacillus paralicheniformis TaxID=1648923 RepID=UPI0038557F74